MRRLGAATKSVNLLMQQQATSRGRAEVRRERLVKAAAEQFHRHGVSATALAEVARAAAVPPGNMFYYFRTKESLARAVVDALVERVDAMLAEIDGCTSAPSERVGMLLDRAAGRGEAYAALGCPLAGIARDLRQLNDDPELAARPLQRLTSWVETQLSQAGDLAAKGHALFVVAALQGAFVLAHAAADPSIVAEVRRCLDEWLEASGTSTRGGEMITLSSERRSGSTNVRSLA